MFWLYFVLGIFVGTMLFLPALQIISKLRTHFAKSDYDIAY